MRSTTSTPRARKSLARRHAKTAQTTKKVHNGKARYHRAEPLLRGTVQPQLHPLDIAGTPG
jgi:hypothetical protein